MCPCVHFMRRISPSTNPRAAAKPGRRTEQRQEYSNKRFIKLRRTDLYYYAHPPLYICITPLGTFKTPKYIKKGKRKKKKKNNLLEKGARGEGPPKGHQFDFCISLCLSSLCFSPFSFVIWGLALLILL